MEKKLGVLILHGIGENKPGFADKMIKGLNSYIKKNGYNPEEVAYEPCCWDTLMQPREKKLWDNINIYNDLSWDYLRKFCVNALTDAVSYQESFGRHGGIYDEIHKFIHNSLKNLKSTMGSNVDKKPLVVMAHSFGGYVISDYIWDRQHSYDSLGFGGEGDFVNMKNTVGIITSGCNIPFFVVAYDNVQSIDLPCKDFNLYKYKHLVRWDNYYDKNDILGMPLKGLSDSYNKTVTSDIRISIGNIFTSWNPLNHLGYREDNSFLKPVAKYLCDILKVG